MGAICLVDTSVFLEILNVPGKASRHKQVLIDLKRKVENDESLFLPMATIFETGNHIGQSGDGRLRRECAERFVRQVGAALDGRSPFSPMRFPKKADVMRWIEKFPDHANRGSGLGDLSIVQDWERSCARNPARRVYVWSFDKHLFAFDRAESGSNTVDSPSSSRSR